MRKHTIALLGQSDSVHIIKWVNGLADREYNIHLISHKPRNENLYPSITHHKLPYKGYKGYILNTFALKKILNLIQPHLLHAHYASGYGTLGRLSGFHPLALSVWGSDVYEFPDKSLLHKKIIVDNLKYASIICSTSHTMAERTRGLLPTIDDIHVTPFGININDFSPRYELKGTDPNVVIIGTVKSLSDKYGIDLLLKAFALLQTRVYDKVLKLNIVGDGPDKGKLQQLSKDLGIEEHTTFVGKVPHNEVPLHLNQFDIYVAPSRRESESFGVAVAEASACEIPVVVTNIGGLPEVVSAEKTGFLFEKEDINDLADRLLQLVQDKDLRETMGREGRKFVQEHYSWEHSVDLMERVYSTVLR